MTLTRFDSSSPPKKGKEFRFGPSRGETPVATIWKLSVIKSDIYIFARLPGHAVKISVHKSGQVHLSLAPKQNVPGTPCIRLGVGPWVHALQLRFLLLDNALEMPDQLKSLGKSAAVLIHVAPGAALYLDLIIGDAGIPVDCPLPLELQGRTLLWTETLQDKRRAALLIRSAAFTDEDLADLKLIHEDRRTTLTTQGEPTEALRAELMQVLHERGHNFVVVTPMGREAFRSDNEAAMDAATRKPLPCSITSPTAEGTLQAPDGNPVALISLAATSTCFDLRKGEWHSEVVCTATFQLLLEHLRMGSAFIARPFKLECVPTVNRAHPIEWQYQIAGNFDGTELVIHFASLSAALPNQQRADLVDGLEDGEEFVMHIPASPLIVKLRPDTPNATIDLVGRFAFRNRR